MTDITPDEIALEKPQFDDRIDIETRIGNLEVARDTGPVAETPGIIPKTVLQHAGALRSGHHSRSVFPVGAEDYYRPGDPAEAHRGKRRHLSPRI